MRKPPNIPLASLLNELTVRSVHGRPINEITISSLATDSRKVTKGSLFFALEGEKVDGSVFVDDAINKGAVAVIAGSLPKRESPAVSFLEIADVRAALSKVAWKFFGCPAEQMVNIAVTGTNGKTTTCWLLAEALSALSKPVIYIGTLGVRFVPARGAKDTTFWETTPFTTPDPVLLYESLARGKQSGATFLVCEVSSHALTQKRAADIPWDVGVFTNLTRDHLDYHGSMENYGHAKSLLFTEGLFQSRHSTKAAVINSGDDFGRTLSAELLQKCPGLNVRTFSRGIKSSVFPELVELHENGTTLELNLNGKVLRTTTPLIGVHNVENVLGVVTTLLALGFTLKSIADVLPQLPQVPGRLERIGPWKVPVFVDYAHTPDALSHVMNTLRPLAGNKLIVVFGCGGDRDRGKRPLMGKEVASVASLAVVTSDNPRTERPEKIIEDILPGFSGAPSDFCYEVVVDRREAIFRALTLAEKGDIVLVAGKGHEDYQEVNGIRHPFSDQEECRIFMNRAT